MSQESNIMHFCYSYSLFKNSCLMLNNSLLQILLLEKKRKNNFEFLICRAFLLEFTERNGRFFQNCTYTISRF